MKPRPRRAENTIADLLSSEFEKVGLSRVERKPIIGRTGPDVTLNEMMLVVDAKTRLQVPRNYFKHRTTTKAGDHVFFPISMLSNPPDVLSYHASSILVQRWLDHMDEWRRRECPDGISMLVLHRPKMPYGECLVVIKYSDLKEYQRRWKLLSK